LLEIAHWLFRVLYQRSGSWHGGRIA
jgi:hypothetical protein